MKLLKALTISSIFLITNIFAATISGNTYCDLNGNGIQDPDETCTNEAVWVKLQNVESEKIVSQEPLHPSGEFSFNVNKTGEFKLFIDSNGDGKDSTPTPPANTLFGNPSSGSIDITISSADDVNDTSKFGLIPDPVCDCTNADGIILERNITIDGDMSDWTDVYTDPDNTQCDPGDQRDHDINKTVNGEIQSTGRNLVRFSRTANPDLGYAYNSTKRVGSSKNTETFLFYRGGYDGRMHTTTATNGSVVLVASWQGNTGTVKIEACDYDAIDDVNGDAMFWEQSDIDAPTSLSYPGGTNVPQSWLNKADGYTVQGELTNCRKVDGLIGMGSDSGVEMEMQIPLSLLKLDPNLGFPYYHVSTMNASVNDSNPPGQIDDNLGPCELVPGPDFQLSVEKVASTAPYPIGEELTYTVTVTNNGPDDTVGTIYANDTLPAGMTYVDYSGADWSCTNSGQDVNCTYSGIILNGAVNSDLQIIAQLDNDKALWGSTLTNTVCVESTIDDTPVCDDENITVYTPVIDLGITKTVSDATPYENTKVYYEINVANSGPDDATNVVVNDVLPDINANDRIRFDYFHGDNGWSCTNTLQDVNCTYALTLKSGASTSFHIHVDVNGTDGTTYTNNACADADENTNNNVCDRADIDPVAVPPETLTLDITKDVNNSTPFIGDTILYTMRVTNLGDSNTTLLEVNDTLPPEVTFVSATPAGASQSGQDIIWSGVSLDVGETKIFTITATVDSGLNTQIQNTACTDAFDDKTVNGDCASINITPRLPDVTMLIDKTVDNTSPRINDQVTYTIVVTNDGTDFAHNVEVNDTLPPGVTYISSSSTTTGTYTPNTWDVGTLAPNTSEELNITVSIDAGQENNDISNLACVNADENTTQVCDDANLTVAEIIITAQKIASPNRPAEGDLVTYTIVVNNTGNAPATDVNVTDTLPTGVTYVSAGGIDWTCDDINDPIIVCTYANELFPYIPISFDVNVTVDPGTSGETLTNTACTIVNQSAVDDAGDPIPVCTDVNITVNDNLDLSVTKVVNNSAPVEGSSVIYTITVTNNGPLTATNVEITEDIIYISALTVTNLNPSQGNMSDDETWSVGDLAVGASATLQVTATVNAGSAGGTYVNNAVLTDLGETDIDSSNNHAQATITVTAEEIPCPCNDVKSDSSSTFGTVSAALMILMTLMAGLFFVRREAQLNRYER